jgi:hypothetical protein
VATALLAGLVRVGTMRASELAGTRAATLAAGGVRVGTFGTPELARARLAALRRLPFGVGAVAELT